MKGKINSVSWTFWIKRNFLFTVLFLCLSPSCIFADGGTLKFRQSIPDEEISSLMPDRLFIGIGKQAMMRLDREKAEDVYVVDYPYRKKPDQPQNRIIISQSKPPRLFYDLNGDNTFQSNEIYTAQPGKPNPAYSIYTVKNVKLPLIDGSSHQILETDIQLSFEPKIFVLQIINIKSCYEGILHIADTDISARLVLLSPSQYSIQENKLVILDTTMDGKFNYIEDTWFTDSKVAYIAGKIWNVTIELKDTGADVQLTPYLGSTGKLVVAGENFHRLSLESYAEGSQIICLPKCEDPAYTIPVGDYSIKKIWLKTENPNEFLETIDSAMVGLLGRNMIQIKESETKTVEFSGKLKSSLRANYAIISGNVFLQYAGIKGIGQYAFAIINNKDAGKFSIPPAPQWEILDAKNAVIATGRLEYG